MRQDDSSGDARIWHLAAVGVGARVGHREKAGLDVLELRRNIMNQYDATDRQEWQSATITSSRDAHLEVLVGKSVTVDAAITQRGKGGKDKTQHREQIESGRGTSFRQCRQSW